MLGKNKLERRADDSYQTPQELANKICKALLWEFEKSPQTVLEPSCGTGAFLKASSYTWYGASITGIDINEEYVKSCVKNTPANYVFANDFLNMAEDRDFKFDLIIGNPPYSLAEEFVQKGLTLLEKDGHLAFLLRLSFLASKERSQRLYRNSTNFYGIMPIAGRPSFTEDNKTDGSEYAVFIWKNAEVDTRRILPHLFWKD